MVGPYNLQQDFDCYSNSNLPYYATRAADKDLNYKNFSRVVIIRPAASCEDEGTSTLGCGYSCLGDNACGHSVGWLTADKLLDRETGVQKTLHSLGHHLGLGHASSLDFGTEPVGALDALGNSG